jgi:multisubunit Na+/H+ antiporter MnhF subunit
MSELVSRALLYMVWFLIGSVVVSLVRVLIGPTVADRMTALNMVSAQILAILVLVAVREGRTSYLDVALVYDIFGFIGTLAMARYFSRRDSGAA